jgi:hypothetical protein
MLQGNNEDPLIDRARVAEREGEVVMAKEVALLVEKAEQEVV